MKNLHQRRLYDSISAVFILLSVFVFFNLSEVASQTLNDGPIELKVKLREVQVTSTTNSDATLDLGSLTPPTIEVDEYTFKVWGRDNSNIDAVNWSALGGTCHTHEANPPFTTSDFDDLIYDFTFTGASVPQFFDLKLQAWEDDIPTDFACNTSSRCTYDGSTCCFFIFGNCIGSEDDDRFCDADPFKSAVDYRLGPPCEWFSHGFVTGSGCSNLDYDPHIESYWRYTSGTACNDAIDLGTLTVGGTLSHFNSTVCYTNNFASSSGNDVFYSFNIPAAMGVSISLCGANGAQFDSYLYLLDSNCVIDTFDDNGCGSQSVISKPLCVTGTWYVVVDAVAALEMGTFTLNVSENPQFSFTANITPTDVLCNGANDGQASVSVSGGATPYIYNWSPAGTTSSITNLSAGSVAITVTDDEGCVTTATATVNEPAAMSVSITSQNVSCNGANDGQATANVLGGTTPYSYLWNTNPPQALQTALLLSAGNFAVTITDVNGCTATASTVIGQTTTITISTVNASNISCFGTNDGSIDISVSGGGPPYTYAWSNSEVTQDIQNLPPGNYTVTVTDLDNCFEIMSYAIIEPALLTSTINNSVDVSCNGGTDGGVDLGVAGGTLPYNYSWNNSSTTEDLLSATAGTHVVTVTDANGCTTTSSVTISEPSALVTSLTVTHPSCDGANDGSADLTVLGGTPPYSFLWSNFEVSEDVSNLAPGTYTVVITDANFCFIIDSTVLVLPAPLSSTITSSDATCYNGNDGSINLSVSGGGTPYSFNWSNAANMEDLTDLTAGNYSVTITDANGCAITNAAMVAEPAELDVVALGVDVVCIGDSNGVATVEVNGGGSGPYSYLWNTGSNASLIEQLNPGQYSITVTDADGCSAESSVFISNPVEDPEGCIGGQFAIVVPNAFSLGSSIAENIKFEILQKGARVVDMRIFNRWGQEIYYHPDVTESGNGWDGTYEGKPVPMGSYAYVINVEFWNGNARQMVGSVTLIW